MARAVSLGHGLGRGVLPLLAAWGAVGLAHAQPPAPGSGSASASLGMYMDSDDTMVHSILADGSVALPADIQIGANAMVDMVSSASVDVISNATVDLVAGASARHSEVRYQLGGRATMFVTPEIDIGLSFARSAEEDWLSYSPAGTVGIDLAKRNTRLTAGYGYVYNEVGYLNDADFAEQLDNHTARLGYSQLLGKRSLVGAAYTFQAALGWQSSPYRSVTLGDGTRAREQHPDTRYRHTVSFQALRYLGSGVAIEGSYGLYTDSWGITANRWGTGVRFELTEQWDLQLRARAYTQDGADFWREQYLRPVPHRSADRELSTFWDAGGGVRGAWHLDGWTVDLNVDVIHYRFLNYALLDHRTALISAVGVALAW